MGRSPRCASRWRPCGKVRWRVKLEVGTRGSSRIGGGRKYTQVISGRMRKLGAAATVATKDTGQKAPLSPCSASENVAVLSRAPREGLGKDVGGPGVPRGGQATKLRRLVAPEAARVGARLAERDSAQSDRSRGSAFQCGAVPQGP